jgi:DNA-directed RNA polymerase specialized sigma24 family protein
MDENQLLQQLVAQAQSHPDRSSQRRIVLSKLIIKIRQSPHLKKPVNTLNIPNYQDIYDEALNDTCMEIHRRINIYNPEHPVMAWVNHTLNYRIKDVNTKYQKRGITDIPRNQKPIWWDLDRPIQSHDSQSNNKDRQIEIPILPAGDEDSELLRVLIAEDPDGMFATRHIQDLPNATFQNICLMLFEDKSWKEIAEFFGTSISTASGFYRNNLDRLLEYLRESLIIK